MTLSSGRPLRSGGLLSRGKPLKKLGERGTKWKNFRDATFDAEKDEEGLIRCQDYLTGLEPCGISRSEMDLHHTQGRDGKLLLDRSKMVWLTRECHDTAHNQR